MTTLEGPGTPGPSSHYQVVVHHRDGREHVQQYESASPLEVGDVLRLEGRHWLVESIDGPRVTASPARYRLTLRHPDGSDDVGVFRRFRPDAPRVGHTLATIEDGAPVDWQVVEQRLARDESGEPFLELIAERDFAEVEEASDHELEHAFAGRDPDEVPDTPSAALARAQDAGLDVELVALEPGEEPDWEAAERYVDALIFEEIEDDLFVLCGVDTRRDPTDTWLQTVKDRLLADLDAFRADVERNHDQIEEWDFRGGRVFVSAGTADDESDPNSGHGWLARLVDSGTVQSAGFTRIRKARLDLLES
jgi:hypothetical protein